MSAPPSVDASTCVSQPRAEAGVNVRRCVNARDFTSTHRPRSTQRRCVNARDGGGPNALSRASAMANANGLMGDGLMLMGHVRWGLFVRRAAGRGPRGRERDPARSLTGATLGPWTLRPLGSWVFSTMP